MNVTIKSEEKVIIINESIEIKELLEFIEKNDEYKEYTIKPYAEFMKPETVGKVNELNHILDMFNRTVPFYM